jgi:hypothetical protein
VIFKLSEFRHFLYILINSSIPDIIYQEMNIFKVLRSGRTLWSNVIIVTDLPHQEAYLFLSTNTLKMKGRYFTKSGAWIVLGAHVKNE